MDYEKVIKMFSVGDIVCIKDNGLEATNNSYTAVDKMREMVGSTCKIDNIKRSQRHRGIAAISCGGFTWHADDLHVVEHSHRGPLVTDSGQTGVYMFDPKTI